MAPNRPTTGNLAPSPGKPPNRDSGPSLKILVLVLVGLFMAISLEPVVRWLTGKGLRRPWPWRSSDGPGVGRLLHGRPEPDRCDGGDFRRRYGQGHPFAGRAARSPFPHPSTAQRAHPGMSGWCVPEPGSRLWVGDQFEQGAIGIAEVDTHSPATPATASYRSFLRFDLLATEMSQRTFHRAGPDEAEVAAAGHDRWAGHQAAHVQAGTVHVELLIVEPIGDATIGMVYDLGSQHVSVERVRPLPFADRNHAVVKLDVRLVHDQIVVPFLGFNRGADGRWRWLTRRPA